MQKLHELGIESICRNLKNDLREILSWKWDDRFEMLLSEFPVIKKDEIRSVLDLYFKSAWDKSNISTAPEPVRKIAEIMGGIRKGQLLLSSDATQDIFLFGAWWPWGDSSTISLRMAIYGVGISRAEYETISELLKRWFCI